ncbi:MAG: methionine--tRNA ligase subunit beta, partial [Spirochaetales bacterium]|nr:methionine--tRNA ligase subunit beta [Spirochaetales bacterium]
GPLFPRLESRKKEKKTKEKVDGNKIRKKKRIVLDEEELVSFDNFQKLDLRVAEIVAVKPVKKSNKLLKLTVKDPEERTIVSGIAEYYQPSELVGRLVIVVANLKPVKIMGVLSQGMILTAAEKISLDIKDCLVVEDAVNGVKAAKTAGAKCLGLTTSFSEKELSEADWFATTLEEARDEVLTW